MTIASTIGQCVIRRLRFVLPLAALTLLAGCLTTTPKVAVLEPTSVRPEPTPMSVARQATAHAAPVANGSIFHAGSFRGLFEDRKARMVGDIVTVQIQEKTSARSDTNSTLNRSGKAEGAVTQIPLLSATASILPKLGIGGSSNNEFEGKGGTKADNAFTGTITTTVLDVLPNGNLVVAGEKQVGINRNVEILRFSGVINPATVLPGNVVSSTQVADARLEVRSHGDVDRAHRVGWLSRFFMSFAPI